MKKSVEINLSPTQAAAHDNLKVFLSQKEHIPVNDITGVRLLKRSIDARQKNIRIHLMCEIWVGETFDNSNKYDFKFQNVTEKPPVIIVGAGPAGLFAAIRLIELGFKPVIVERGKVVEERKHDIAAINIKRTIDPDSNYCYGEGGAGTYSDGKLYTRSTKRGDVNHILYLLHHHGASDEILVDSHPHIGTDKLPKILTEIRNTILMHGGEFHFGQRVTDLIMRDGETKGVQTMIEQFEGKAVILATGHSARDIYEILLQKNVILESKPFAVGVRIEHPQQLIDSVQYHASERSPYLPPATYSLKSQVQGKGVFSFCMCPGGIIVNSSTLQDELVLNGMSNSKRNQLLANSGIVVEVANEDLKEYAHHGTFAGLKFQEQLEKVAFLAGGADLTAPAQNMIDFMENRISASLNISSYYPGLKSFPLHELLPRFIVSRLKEAFRVFDQRMKGYLTNSATLLGVETRTSSPIRIRRDSGSFESAGISKLFPCGEGAGYAGGIVSSAIDGEKCAEAVARMIK